MEYDFIGTKTETVGFVYPINLSTVPVIVRKFLRKLNLTSASYIFAVATRSGYPGPCNPHVALERILRQKNKVLNAYFMINMLDNSPTGLRPSFTASNRNWINQINIEKISQIDLAVQNKIDAIKKTIVNKENYHDIDTNSPSNHFINDLVSRLIEYSTEHSRTEINYFADPQCSGCGICEKVCLSQKIKMVDKKPIWQKSIRCFYCYACFNFCPEQSILISNGKNSYSDKNGRYYHPGISAKDIANQKFTSNL